VGRGEHFKIFIKLKLATPEVLAVIERDLSDAISQHPSAPPNPARSAGLFFKPFPNNTARIRVHDPSLELKDSSEPSGPLEDLAAWGCARMLQHVSEDWYWPGVAITLANATLDGFGLDMPSRTATLNSFLQKFVPASCNVGRTREEAFEQIKLLMQTVRRDYVEHEPEFAQWLSPTSQAGLVAWAHELKTICNQIGAAFSVPERAAVPGAVQQSREQLLMMIFLGMIDCMLLEEADALATAYRLSRLYQTNAARAGQLIESLPEG
jgi:hypothetical protein